MILSLYNKNFLSRNDPAFLYNNIKKVFNKLKDLKFIFPEKFNSNLNNCCFYSFFENTDNFNEIKIENSVFNPNMLLSKIEQDHEQYLNDLNFLYNNFYYDLYYFSIYNSFISNNYNNNSTNYFKFVFNGEDSNSICYKRSPILNYISYKFIKLFTDKFVNSTNFQTFGKISIINKNIFENSINTFFNNYGDEIITKITNHIIFKVLKLNDHSEEYFLIIKNLIFNNINKIKQLMINNINKKINTYYFIYLNQIIISNLSEHIVNNILNYPKNLFYFVKNEIITFDNDPNEYIIQNYTNNIRESASDIRIIYKYFDDIENEYKVGNIYYENLNAAQPFIKFIKSKNGSYNTIEDKYIDDIWDPDDDNDYVNVLRKLNPDLDNYYKTFFVVPDNKLIDNGAYLSHIEIFENQIFNIVKKNIKFRKSEIDSLFYIAAQFAETSPLNYLNSLVFVINNYINDVVNSEYYKIDLDEDLLSDRVVLLLIKNIYINNSEFLNYFNSLNFKKMILKSNSIEYSIFSEGSKLIHDFFDSDDFKDFLFKDFFSPKYLNSVETRFPNVRDDLIDNLNNLINGFKFIFSEYIYDKKLFNEVTDKFKTVYDDVVPTITTSDIDDIYDNYLLNSKLQIPDYKFNIKNLMISYTFSLYINIFLDNYRVYKKFSSDT